MKGETEESLEKVQEAHSSLRSFKDTFFSQRKKLATYFTKSQEFKPWDFQPQMVFARLDMFLNRLGKIEVLVNMLSINIIIFDYIELLGLLLIINKYY